MIRNQELATQILDMINTGIEGAEQLYFLLEHGNLERYRLLSNDLKALIVSIWEISEVLKQEESGLNLPAASESVKVSLDRISMYAENDAEKAMHKIEFELIPLMEDMRMKFYFWGMVYPDKNKMAHYYEYEMKEYGRNVYVEQARKTGIYKYKLSVVILAYNKLEYTKMCVESLLKYIPKSLNYELILANHGSTDETKEYFETIQPHKQLDIAVNGGGYDAVLRIIEGEYQLLISNDVLVTPYAIENMIKCIESSEKIGWVIPTTPNISNLQTVDLEYQSLDELWKVAAKNNISDSFRWEERVRLCNPIELRRSDTVNALCLMGYIHSKSFIAFPDDKWSLLFRRNGYKLMLAKDAYCHHFGSVTIRDDVQQKEESDIYLDGRKDFLFAFGIDPWGTGCCYDRELFEYLPCDKTKSIKILGINTGMGSNALKIKEQLKENVHNLNVKLWNYTMHENFLKDLEGISDHVQFLHSWDEFEAVNHGESFDYILVEEGFNLNNYQSILKMLEAYVEDTGFVVIKLLDEGMKQWIHEHYKAAQIAGSWMYWQI